MLSDVMVFDIVLCSIEYYLWWCGWLDAVVWMICEVVVIVMFWSVDKFVYSVDNYNNSNDYYYMIVWEKVSKNEYEWVLVRKREIMRDI